MKNITKTSLQLTIFIFIVSITFFIITLFWYQNFKNIKDFLENFLVYKNIILIALIFIFSIIIGLFSRFIIWNIFKNIEENNKKLKDYNHYLAHELKTPISVISSNLDVLKYEFDEKIVKNSKKELKNMSQMIDWLLKFSEVVQITEKKNINLENFLKSHINFLEKKDNIKIHNKLFNFHIETDEVLFLRIIKNLIENGLKYSLDKKLDIYIEEDSLIFINSIETNLNPDEIDLLLEKFKRKSKNKDWYWLGLSFIKDLTNILWYKLNVISEDNNFIVEIIY